MGKVGGFRRGGRGGKGSVRAPQLCVRCRNIHIHMQRRGVDWSRPAGQSGSATGVVER